MSPGPAANRVRLLVCTRAQLIGGAEHSLATLLAHLDERYLVSLVAADREVADFLATRRALERVTIIPKAGDQDRPASLAALLKAFAAAEPDLVHLNRTWIWDRPFDILAGLLTRQAKVVVVEHTQPAPTESRLQRARRRWLTGRIDAEVAVGEAAARSYERCLGLPTGRVLTIHNGVEPLPELDPHRPLRKPPVIGAVGRLSREKGYADLPPLLARLPEVRAIVAGEGPERENLLEAAAAAGVSDRFELVGWQADVGEWLPRFDVLVAPSRAEGSPPLAALQAMMAGVPIVAADVGSVSEAIGDHETGLLVPPRDEAALADAVTELLDDAALRSRLVVAARERVREEFEAGGMARRFEALYAEISSAPPVPSEAPARVV